MAHLLRLAALTLALMLNQACDYIPISGGKLEGTVTPPEVGWPGVAEASIIQIETNPTEPYSVKLWVALLDGNLYIHAGKNRATWVEHLEQNPELKLEHDGKLFELIATRVTSQEEFNQFAAVWESKYGNLPRNMNIAEVYAYRLEPRQ